jgi:hypothetical protein
MTRRVGQGALLFGAAWWLAACGGAAAPGGGPDEPSAGADHPLDTAMVTFNDFRGTWHGMAHMGESAHDLRALLLVVGQESLLCERPAVGCVPASVSVQSGTLIVRAEIREGEAVETLEGRFRRPDAPMLEGTLRSSSCDCEGEARLDLTEDESFAGQWEATISFDQVDVHETRELPTEFRSPEPFVLRVRAHGAEACSDAEGGCVNVEWIPQGPQSAFHFEREYEGVRVRTVGHIGRMSNGRIEGEILREGGDYRRSGRIYLREGATTGGGSL